MPRVEIHVNHIVHSIRRANGFAAIRASINDETYNMLVERLPEGFHTGVLETRKNRVGFRLIPALDGEEANFLVVVMRDHSSHTEYSDNHAMYLFEVTEETYDKLKKADILPGYEVDFDFEPIDNPRNYNCSGERK